ncbi:hypothetical protein ABTN31_18880, partial [Acinetobacter baumannii]
ANGLATLNGKVGSSSAVPEIALAALANWLNSPGSAQAVTYFNMLLSKQSVVGDDSWGSWDRDPYATALALRALAAARGADLAQQKQLVDL